MEVASIYIPKGQTYLPTFVTSWHAWALSTHSKNNKVNQGVNGINQTVPTWINVAILWTRLYLSIKQADLASIAHGMPLDDPNTNFSKSIFQRHLTTTFQHIFEVFEPKDVQIPGKTLLYMPMPNSKPKTGFTRWPFPNVPITRQLQHISTHQNVHIYFKEYYSGILFPSIEWLAVPIFLYCPRRGYMFIAKFECWHIEISLWNDYGCRFHWLRDVRY